MGLLDTIYSAGDSAKRYVKGLLGDPVGTVQQNLLNYADQLRQMGEQNKQVLSDPMNAPQSAVSGLLNAAVPAITVWHGTPHKFAPTAKNPLGEFDLGKIGTGEGAQAYGHGVYVAESPSVAKEYQKSLSSSRPEISGMPFDEALNSLNISDKAKAIIRYDMQPPADPERIRRFAEQGVPEYQEAWNVIKQRKDNPGAIYKIDLPDEHLSRFLDWDKPLSQQPAGLLDKVLSEREQMMKLNPNIPPLNMKETGQDFYRYLTESTNKHTATKDMVNAYGIKGIKYFDQGSRAGSNGTSNYVVFDPSILNILDRQ